MLLITGSNGQLGQELTARLPQAICADKNTLDITNRSAVQQFIQTHKISLIINCAAYTAVDKAEDEEESARQANAIAPRILAQTGIPLIHISTDYVFDGKHYRPYQVYDATNPCSIYGNTKLEGEQEVMAHANTAIIIRTSWIYSCFGNNFVKTMRRLGSEKESLNVVSDQIGTPTYAGDLAQAITEIIPQIKAGTKEIYHYSNEGVASWYDFACEIMYISELACNVLPIKSDSYPTRAQRPYYSVMDKSKIKQDFNITIPHWKESLRKCLNQF